MAIVLRTPEQDAELTRTARTNLVRELVRSELPLLFRRQRRLRTEDEQALPVPVQDVIGDTPLDLLPPEIQVGPIPGPIVEDTRTPLGRCIGPGGDLVMFTPAVPAATTLVIASGRIALGYIITHIEVLFSVAQGTDTFVRFKVATDNALTGGEATTGLEFTQGLNSGGHEAWGAIGFPMAIFPNYRVVERGTFIKGIFVNNTGATVSVDVKISLLFI